VLLGYCSDSLAFATEPVVGSLANLLGAVERLPLSCQQELKVVLHSYEKNVQSSTKVVVHIHVQHPIGWQIHHHYARVEILKHDH